MCIYIYNRYIEYIYIYIIWQCLDNFGRVSGDLVDAKMRLMRESFHSSDPDEADS